MPCLIHSSTPKQKKTTTLINWKGGGTNTYHITKMIKINLNYSEAEKKRLQEEAEAAAAAAKVLTEEEEEELANAPPPVLPYSSMFIFSSENGFRCAIHSIVTFPLFDVFIMLVIIASSIALAAEDPVNAESDW